MLLYTSLHDPFRADWEMNLITNKMPAWVELNRLYRGTRHILSVQTVNISLFSCACSGSRSAKTRGQILQFDENDFIGGR